MPNQGKGAGQGDQAKGQSPQRNSTSGSRASTGRQQKGSQGGSHARQSDESDQEE